MLPPDPSRRPTMRESQAFFDGTPHDQSTTKSATREVSVVAPTTTIPRASIDDMGATTRTPSVRAPERVPWGSGGGGCLAPALASAVVGGAGGAGHILEPPTAEGAVMPFPSPPLPLHLDSPPPQLAKHSDTGATTECGLYTNPMVDCLA